MHVSKSAWPEQSTIRWISTYEAASWETTQLLSKQVQLILEQRLETLKKNLPNRQVEGLTVDGAACDSILEEAKNWPADLLIIGSHGETGVRKPGSQSIASTIVNSAPCTV